MLEPVHRVMLGLQLHQPSIGRALGRPDGRCSHLGFAACIDATNPTHYSPER